MTVISTDAAFICIFSLTAVKSEGTELDGRGHEPWRI
jgi:hypothetical protein